MIDAVITYVNGDDPLWKQDYESNAGEAITAKFFRDWGTLPFLFRGLEKNIPFIDKVFLVVSRESQVPQWLNRDKVKVVLHKDIIPEKYLPTFNPSVIEMFLHKIPGLGERYIYLNDDEFPVRKVNEESLFPGGKPAKQMIRRISAVGSFLNLCKDSCSLARKAAGKRGRFYYLRPQLSVTPMLRSACEEAFNAVEEDILSSLTPLRHPGNYNQYFFSDYMFITRKAVSKRISHTLFSMLITNADDVVDFLRKPGSDFVSINDVDMTRNRFLYSKERILDGFNFLFPYKSDYEI